MVVDFPNYGKVGAGVGAKLGVGLAGISGWFGSGIIGEGHEAKSKKTGERGLMVKRNATDTRLLRK